MKKSLLFVFLLLSAAVFSQDLNTVLKEASNFERSLKEDQALEKYKQALSIDANNITALLKCAELNAAIGGRQPDKKVKKTYYEAAKDYATKVLASNAANADANYVMAVSVAKMAEVETENKKTVAYIKDAKVYADKALAINPNHARANYVLGKWNFDMVQMAWAKKVAVKALFGGLPDSKIEDAVKYMEKCRSLDPYYVANYLDLAKAYKYDNKPSQAIEVLQKLVKLPTRTADDANLKAEGKKLLDEML
jgi:tetratricopeptide (TPR) repeat protein